MSDTITLEASRVALSAAVVATAALFGKVFATNMAQAYFRMNAGVRAPEDSSIAKVAGFGPQDFSGPESPKDDKKAKAQKDANTALARINRIQVNDAENIPYGLLIIWAGVFITSNPELHAKLTYAFVGLRYLHTLTYGFGVQPWRTLVFSAGATTLFGMLSKMFDSVAYAAE